MDEVKWPERPAPLERSDGIRWHVTKLVRPNGSVVLACNGKPFCVLSPSKTGHWYAPGAGWVKTLLKAAQEASFAYLGMEEGYAILWTI